MQRVHIKLTIKIHVNKMVFGACVGESNLIPSLHILHPGCTCFSHETENTFHSPQCSSKESWQK